MSVDLLATQLALRARALSLVVATTGATSLSATTTGYARASGSFLTDGFAVGMEVAPSGFAANTVDMLVGVTATTLTTKNARAVEVAANGRTVNVVLPALRNWENAVNPFVPVTGSPYLTEEFIDGPRSLAGSKDGGDVDSTGLYILSWFNPNSPAVGVSALRKSVGALLALFASGTQLTAGSDFVRIRGDQGPYTGQIIPLTGWSGLVLKVPWRVRTRSVIAA